jgi:YD repeat-containing protein
MLPRIRLSPNEQAAYQTWLAGSQTTPFTQDTAYTYDALGNELSETLPDGETEAWTYDAYSHQVLQTDADGHMTWDIYDTSDDGHGRQGKQGRRRRWDEERGVPGVLGDGEMCGEARALFGGILV